MAKEVNNLYKAGMKVDQALLRVQLINKEYNICKSEIMSLKQNEDTSWIDILLKINEEDKEFMAALIEQDKKHIIEEGLDKIQMVITTFSKLGINPEEMANAVLEHNMKLKDRKWEFDKAYFKIV